MSTGLNCSFIEIAESQWYYILEDGGAPKNAWDWREYADAYGPFETKALGIEHLHTYHANPGGYDTWSMKQDDGTWKQPDEVLQKLIDDAPKRMRWLNGP